MCLSLTHKLALAALIAAARLSAAECAVTSLADSGPGTLRDQVQQAATTGCSVTFAVKGTITLLSTILYNSARSLAIVGNGEITISGGQKTRPFWFSVATVRVQNLTIAHGAGDSGGAILSGSPFLALSGITFDSNTATNSGGAVALQSEAGASISGCTFVRNSAQFGGAISGGSDTGVSIVNSTFTQNKAEQGGAIGVNFSRATVSFSTIVGNTATAGGGIYQVRPFDPTTPTRLSNTIVANNGGGNCACPASSSTCMGDSGGNLTYPDNTCPGTIADPKLWPLWNNGGFTATMALRPGSPAIDAVACGDVTTDQRGVIRPQGARCDIGAYEASPIVFIGFLPPVLNPPFTSSENAGQAVPIRFSAGGFNGMDIIATGYPVSAPISCATGLPTGDPSAIVSSPAGLTYDRFWGVYSLVWNTDKAWAGTCRELTVRLKDGLNHVARFRFR